MFRLNTDTILKGIEWLLNKLSKEINVLSAWVDKHNEEVAIAQAKAADASAAKTRAENLRAKLGKLFD